MLSLEQIRQLRDILRSSALSITGAQAEPLVLLIQALNTEEIQAVDKRREAESRVRAAEIKPTQG